MDEVLTAVGNAGKIKIYTSGQTTLLGTFTLPTPSGTVSTDTLTFDCDIDLTAIAVSDGTPAVATVTTSGDVEVITGLTVATSGADITVSQASVVNGGTLTMTAASIQHG